MMLSSKPNGLNEMSNTTKEMTAGKAPWAISCVAQ